MAFLYQKSDILKYLAEVSDLDQTLMVDIVEVFQLPGDVEGDMDGPGTDGKRWGDVALQRVADHQQVGGVDALVLTEGQELALGLVGGNLHIVEIVQQSRALQLVLLVLQLALGKHHQFQR